MPKICAKFTGKRASSRPKSPEKAQKQGRMPDFCTSCTKNTRKVCEKFSQNNLIFFKKVLAF
jgi:hypothetical protein